MKNKISYVVCTFLTAVVSALTAVAITANKMEKKIHEKANMSDKHLELYLLMNEWVHVKQDGKSLIMYFQKRNYKKIAIYGMNFVGETLLRELEGSDIEVVFAVDQNADHIFGSVEVIKPDEPIEAVDAIVITPIYYFETIEKQLMEKVDCPIISIEEIVKSI